MKWLINYFKECFCNHDFNYEEKYYVEKSDFCGSREGDKVSVTCKKCGYHKSYWKFFR